MLRGCGRLAAHLIANLFLLITHNWLATAIVLFSLFLRLTLMLLHDDYVGIDGGAYILSALDVQGEKEVSVGFPRPPLAPGWLFVPFLELWGPSLGYKLWAILASLPVLLPVYLLGRDLVNRSGGLFCLAFYSLDFMAMEMMIDGALPLLAFALLGMAVWAIYRLVEQWSRLHFFVLAAAIGLIPYINQTTTGLAAILLPILLLATWKWLRKDKGEPAPIFQANIIFHILPAMLLGTLLSLGALPWYLANMPGNDELRFPGPILFPVSPLDTSVFQAILVLALCCWLYNRGRQEELERPDYRLKSAGVLLAIMGVMALFVSYDEAVINIIFRARWLMALLVYPIIAWFLCLYWPLDKWRKDWPIYSALIAAFAVLVGVYVWGFNDHAKFKDQALPETVAALEIAAQERPGMAIITNFYSLSHWVAALNGVESPNVWALEPSPKYQEEDRLVRCLFGWVSVCDVELAAQELNAGYLLVDARFPELDMGQRAYGAIREKEPWRDMDKQPWLTLRYQEGKASLWEVNPSNGGQIE